MVDFARIDYSVAKETAVKVRVVDVQGRTVATLVDRVQPVGRYQVQWRGETPSGRAPAGMYFVRYEASKFVATKRLALTR
jgi:flagellar hook assembly protein FlgD